jgi:hypothetical protein
LAGVLAANPQIVSNGGDDAAITLSAILDCHRQSRPKYCGMKFTKNVGMLLLAVYLIIDGLLGFGLNLGPFVFLLYLVALAAGVFILIGK